MLNKNKKAFSLIEVLLVVGMLALSGIAVITLAGKISGNDFKKEECGMNDVLKESCAGKLVLKSTQ